MLKGRKILLGVTGSIAAYKSAQLVRLLIKAGAEVKVIMTPSAKDFISPLTLSTLSKNPVLSDITNNDAWANHVMLGRWADLMVIAPLSCNTLAKMSQGLCDNLLMAVYLSATCPVMIAPAMDEDMWLHPSTKKNMALLESFSHLIAPVGKGELASGLHGHGRMAEPEDLLQRINEFFLTAQSLSGKKVLITAGPTYEAIDPVRFIGNFSTGKMGTALATVFRDRGAKVTLVAGPMSAEPPSGIEVINVVSAQEMYDACMQHFSDCDIAVLAAAVADYRPDTTATQKIKKQHNEMNIQLTQTTDILKSLGELKRDNQILVGFALETTDEESNAKQKLISKKADFIVLNSLRDEGAGFGGNTNKITIFGKDRSSKAFELKSKAAVAADIVNTITAIP